MDSCNGRIEKKEPDWGHLHDSVVSNHTLRVTVQTLTVWGHHVPLRMRTRIIDHILVQKGRVLGDKLKFS